MSSEIEVSSVNAGVIKRILPDWKTRITNIGGNSDGHVRIKFLIAAKTVDEIKSWIEKFQEKNYTTYYIRTTMQGKGRYIVFKQILYCHHNTRSPGIYKKQTKNTKCPSKLTVTLHATKQRYRGKNKEIGLSSEMPCEIDLIATHNHAIKSKEALQFRRVSNETKQKLLELFQKGHTPSMALKRLRTDIRLAKSNPEISLKDRKICPDYNYCYYLYRREFKGNYEDASKTSQERNASEILQENASETSQENNDGFANDEHMPQCIESPAKTAEDDLRIGRSYIEETSAVLNRFLEEHPDEMVLALKSFKEKLTNVKTKAALISGLRSFPHE